MRRRASPPCRGTVQRSPANAKAISVALSAGCCASSGVVSAEATGADNPRTQRVTPMACFMWKSPWAYRLDDAAGNFQGARYSFITSFCASGSPMTCSFVASQSTRRSAGTRCSRDGTRSSSCARSRRRSAAACASRRSRGSRARARGACPAAAAAPRLADHAIGSCGHSSFRSPAALPSRARSTHEHAVVAVERDAVIAHVRTLADRGRVLPDHAEAVELPQRLLRIGRLLRVVRESELAADRDGGVRRARRPCPSWRRRSCARPSRS